MSSLKFALLTVLQSTFEALPQIQKVVRSKHWPMLSDAQPFPALYYFTGADKASRKNEQIVEVNTNLVVGVYIPLGGLGPASFYDKADDIQVAIEDALCALVRPDLAGAYFQKMHSWTWDQHIPNDTIGILGLDAQCVYYHAWGNASANI